MERRDFLSASLLTGLCGICGLPLHAGTTTENTPPDERRRLVDQFGTIERFAGVQFPHEPIQKVFHIGPKPDGSPADLHFEIEGHSVIDSPHVKERHHMRLPNGNLPDPLWRVAHFIQHRATIHQCENVFDLYRAARSIAKETRRSCGNVLIGDPTVLKGFFARIETDRPGAWHSLVNGPLANHIVAVNGLQNVLFGFDGSSQFDAGCLVGVSYEDGVTSMALFDMGVSKYWRIVA